MSVITGVSKAKRRVDIELTSGHGERGGVELLGVAGISLPQMGGGWCKPPG
jgi:hypothetical protein